MAGRRGRGAAGILLCAAAGLLLASGVAGQRDCTGVECPPLENCIEETLEAGACCATCERAGCLCQGYEYYDCLNAGHRGGKVPAGESYYVDHGSTECKCPEGGGQIGCSFIPCPQLPANCVRSFRPQDGCPQCARLGCLSGGHTYPAGHTFRAEPCTVCRCLSSGALSCSPAPGCPAQTRTASPVPAERREAPAEGQGREGRAEGGDGGKRGENPCSQVCTSAGHSMVCSCSPGYQLMNDGTSCEDIDECQEGFDSCEPNLVCQNTAGGLFTDCLLLFPTDTDECRTRSQPCAMGDNCINTIGSYTCQRNLISCGRGYHAGDGKARCVDIDECQTGTHRCDAENICRNTPGSYRCDCHPGYRVDPFSKACVDIDECRRYTGRICAQNCENTPGSYHCVCGAGYRLAQDGRNCEDINECETSPCGQDCANVYGSFQCYCRHGYTLNRMDRTTCDDIDECSLTASALCAYRCINTPGTFNCICPEEGYVLSPNGRNCRDLDECALGTHNCTSAETCFNVQGRYKCLSFECPANYRRVTQTRCERLACQDYIECQTMPQRISYYQLSFPTNIRVPANIFRISPSPVYAGDNILLGITGGNQGMHFSTRRLNNYTGFVYLQLPPRGPGDFLLDVEMTLIRHSTATKFIARIYVFITGPAL
uniref:fibulin-2-like n=1 Tax=Pristiophorus japonicus TaxID=55135 RepID=UPI00398ECC8F